MHSAPSATCDNFFPINHDQTNFKQACEQVTAIITVAPHLRRFATPKSTFTVTYPTQDCSRQLTPESQLTSGTVYCTIDAYATPNTVRTRALFQTGSNIQTMTSDSLPTTVHSLRLFTNSCRLFPTVSDCCLAGVNSLNCSQQLQTVFRHPTTVADYCLQSPTVLRQ